MSLAIEPQEIETYPESEVVASVAFPKSYCEPSIGSLVPETWISLIYCGHSSIECKLENISHMTQVCTRMQKTQILKEAQPYDDL